MHKPCFSFQCPGSGHDPITGTNLIYSPGFYGGAPGRWSCFGCTLAVDPLVKNYITATGRTATWQGPSWILTGKLGQGKGFSATMPSSVLGTQRVYGLS
jgi:hypothetical protein